VKGGRAILHRDPIDDLPGGDANRDLRQLIKSAWVVQAIHAAAALGVADRLATGPRDAAALAAEVGAAPGQLRRLLRALTALGLVRALDGDRWELTPLGTPLRSDVPDSLRSYAVLHGGQLWGLWGRLPEAVRSGRPPLPRGTAFDRMRAGADQAGVFGDAMTGATSASADALARALPLDGVRTLLDVGGGHGALLAAVLAARPQLRGLLVDLPYVEAPARALLEAAGVGERCEVHAGDFFTALPAGADAALLKSVLHDWDDAQCGALLAVCRRALGAGGRLVVVERLLPERIEATVAHRDVVASDLTMMIATGGRERTLEELTALLAASGFDVCGRGHAAGYDVVEARATA